jgi:hypothetical protein
MTLIGNKKMELSQLPKLFNPSGSTFVHMHSWYSCQSQTESLVLCNIQRWLEVDLAATYDQYSDTVWFTHFCRLQMTSYRSDKILCGTLQMR